MNAQVSKTTEEENLGGKPLEDLKEVLKEANSAGDSAVSFIIAQLKIVEGMLADIDDEERRGIVEQLKGLTARVYEAKSTFEARAERINSPYIPSPELELVVREAGILQRPLLLEGEPGTGKTSLAYWLSGVKNIPLIHKFLT